MRNKIGVVGLLSALFLLSVPMFANASPLTIHEEPIYSNSVKEGDESSSRIMKGKDIDLSFLAESNKILNEEQYLEKWKIPSEYVNSGQIATDFGVVTMQEDLSVGAGTLDLENASSRTVKVGGYPADKPNYNQYIMSGSASLSNGVLSYTIDTYGGQSGAPVLDNNTNKVIGAHSSGSTVNQKNYGTALDPIKIIFIKH
ncbi:MAG TPA: hypothetical protein VF095_07880 [Bacillota bacterium]